MVLQHLTTQRHRRHPGTFHREPAIRNIYSIAFKERNIHSIGKHIRCQLRGALCTLFMVNVGTGIA
ncbi:hypothetical protein [Lampropedia cohaerens]|uniref:hypothetical protein n=1 Tax=Lampropedia cohaerens TaxID=1610491 RepID=UPI0012E3641F|nr:hypothetical protein [Lampropedia cohaerens]